MRFRTAAPAALAAALTITACTHTGDSRPTDGPTGASDSGPVPAAVAQLPEEPYTVIDAVAGDEPGADAVEGALDSSRLLFSAAEIVIIAPADDRAAVLRAGAVGIALGAPLLLMPTADDAGDSPVTAELAKEVDRLGAGVALSIGTVDTDVVDELGDLTRVEAPAAAAELGSLLGLDLSDATDLDPEANATTTLAGLEAGQVPPAPEEGSADPGDDPADLPALTVGERVGGLNVIVDDDPAQAGAVANARAAGATLAIAPGDPRSAPGPISELPEPEATVGFGPYGDPDTFAWQVATAATGEEIPGGGQLVFNHKRYIALYGSPHSDQLGVLGQQDLPASIDLAASYAAEYDDLTDDEVIPALEVIVTVASGSAGADGDYSNEWPAQDYVPMIEAAADAGQYVILDFQPGRTNFLDQVRDYEELLAYPNVGIALDPEWRLKSDQVHLRQIGSVGVDEVNTVVDYVADYVREHELPQKMIVLHQFQRRMITDRADLDLSRPEVAVLIHADGNGTPHAKLETWKNVRTDAPAGVYWGWKNFLEKDSPMLTPEQTFEIEPMPDYVSYQ